MKGNERRGEERRKGKKVKIIIKGRLLFPSIIRVAHGQNYAHHVPHPNRLSACPLCGFPRAALEFSLHFHLAWHSPFKTLSAARGGQSRTKGSIEPFHSRSNYLAAAAAALRLAFLFPFKTVG